MPDPDDLLDYAAIAALLSTPDRTVKPSSVRGYRTRGQMPEPDELPAPDRPRWRRSTITEWLANRPGKGKRTDLTRKEPLAAVAQMLGITPDR
ncbi:MarR family transcriptional regulator [Frankia sp. AvcI1]|uniref:MarR family transcriptional regulator n=1 Tax=Frankia sp. AvcI1 TaxID=573496 RepID=UPI0021173791|nr:MarR family transcriptional regulator [Frankia sp. AvcI1]